MHWSSYEMAKYLKRHEGISVSHNFISTLWREHDLKPHLQGTFKVSTDPEFSAKVVDIVGLYLNPPTAPWCCASMRKPRSRRWSGPSRCSRWTSERAPSAPTIIGDTGTTNLFAALDILTGKVVGRCLPRKRTGEFLKFLNRLLRDHLKSKEIHVILDNLKTHDNEEVAAWLTKHPNVRFHYTPKDASWISQIETWFEIITRQAIRRGSFRSFAELIKKIDDYIRHWNEDAEPFEWTVTAGEILEKVAMLDRDYRKLVANNIK